MAAKFSNLLADKIENGMKQLPEKAKEKIVTITEASLTKTLDVALLTLGEKAQRSSDLSHTAAVALSGAVGGGFGLAALAVELPVSTSIMLRSIADIARSEGENLKAHEARLACLEVFAYGGTSPKDDAAETDYFVIRAGLAKTVKDAASYIASAGAAREAAPPIVRLIGQIAARFSIPVTEKAAIQAVPIIGAAGGAIVNTLFINHFQDAARGHFIVRRLERLYGHEEVRSVYDQLPSESDDGANTLEPSDPNLSDLKTK